MAAHSKRIEKVIFKNKAESVLVYLRKYRNCPNRTKGFKLTPIFFSNPISALHVCPQGFILTWFDVFGTPCGFDYYKFQFPPTDIGTNN